MFQESGTGGEECGAPVDGKRHLRPAHVRRTLHRLDGDAGLAVNHLHAGVVDKKRLRAEMVD